MAEQNKDIIPTQFIKKDFDLSKKIDSDFLNLIKDNFGNDVSVISLAILVNNPEDESKKELISFNYRNDKEQKNNEIIVDISNPNSFDKLRRIL
ncbi:hypothetical protein [Methanobrevibacter thaueri]|uniref:Uncharacterized protein n=1 Tax=Methanobrevibacter thaueri TaxID=190975 RepID=A0A315XP09_9EURY|nr:hypothetical protein [Methanobrevibacter thaueri]PWB88085.1 hypothetical protein MBBTH_02290 [Methanobrevibacter thaueri]